MLRKHEIVLVIETSYGLDFNCKSLSSFLLKYFAIILIANLAEFALLRISSTCLDHFIVESNITPSTFIEGVEGTVWLHAQGALLPAAEVGTELFLDVCGPLMG